MKMVWGGELLIQVVSGIASSLLPFASAGTVLYLLGGDCPHPALGQGTLGSCPPCSLAWG